MPDHLVSCWVASTPAARVWRHPCIVLLMQLLLRQLAHCACLLRALPGASAAALGRGAQQVSGWLRLAPRRCACADAQLAVPPELPLVVLQRLGAWLPPADAASARLVCRAWRHQLGAQVGVVSLQPTLWQRPARGQVSQLRRLTSAFPLLRTLSCRHQRGAPVDARSMRRTMGFLATSTPTLAALRLRGMVDAQCWPALAEGIAPLAPQLRALDLQEACWPDAASTAALATTLTQLQRLRLHSGVFSRLAAHHVEAIAGMTRLRELSLGFRTVEGTAASPLALDPLARLARLESLDLEYTGLLELSGGARFARPERLSALTALTALGVRLVPLPSVDGLRALPALRALALVQAAPLTPRQVGALSCCRGLVRLEVEPLPWELLPALGRLTRLRALSVRLHQPPRGDLPPGAADALLGLLPLCRLQSFGLAGPLELAPAHVSAVAAAWRGLRSLDLCCGLAAGTAGFAALTSLRRLRLSPHHWDVWSSDAPVLLHPAELPASLTCLEARDVWVAAPGQDAARLAAAGRVCAFSWDGSAAQQAQPGGVGAVGAGGGSNSSVLEGGLSRSGSGSSLASSSSGGGSTSSCGADAAHAAEAARPQERRRYCLCGSAASVAGCICGGDAVAAPRFAHTPQPTPCSGTAERAAGAARRPPASSPAAREAALTLSTPRLRRLVLRCVSGAAVAGHEPLPLPRLSRLSALEQLDLHHSQITDRDLDAITSSPAAPTLRALRLVLTDDGARVGASVLARLTRLTALESLQVHAHERSLGRSVRAAMARMSSLRRLTLVTSPDFPSRFAHGLLVLTRLRQLAVLRVGLGFGAMDALHRLGGCVARALPECRFEALPDADRLLDEEEEGPAADKPPLDGGAAAKEAGDEPAGDDDEDDAGAGGVVAVAGRAVGASAAMAAVARVHGPRYVRLVRASWGG
ncbi:hypothetical protein Rsub_04887 [Raphidocelis subcapitata]|uniref:F-box domain-containing protein n=1 Tax=Raphidocelis subcapitata TaxID=307507 RepID=A0A2V0NU82_9CHLO|nr:hypothetical protein Rsub_04887 [Raphidocelis subcapitata]|eukprot:GBF91218.1 hypothetical protein Rsub_04887 [Raphidocelis subcapitata]